MTFLPRRVSSLLMDCMNSIFGYIAWSKMNSLIVISVVTLTLFVEVAVTLKCPECSKIHCDPKKASRLNCKGGITTGVCGCCPKCAKVQNETCGGDFSYMGKCDRKLKCVPTGNSSTFISRFHTLERVPVGVCKKVKRRKKTNPHQSDAAYNKDCRPKCTEQYCRKNPRAICSASDAADTIIDGHGKCQHTSCRACAFVKEPNCPACKRDDFRCLKKFGKCIQRHICSSRKKSCKWSKKLKKMPRGKLVCRVPDCL